MFEITEPTKHALECNIEAYARKGSLQDLLQGRLGQPFSLEEAFAILTQIGQALSYAHKCDVTHGDLKPQNILFDDKGDVLLADFFLHALAKQPNNATTPESSAYRAPELLPGQASKQGDQYALGCIAYEMFTGHKPFLTPSVSKPGTFYRTKAPIPPRRFNPALSSLCEEAILKAIAKEPAQRYPDICFFLTALGIPTDTGKHTTDVTVVSLPLALDPPEQANPPRALVGHAIEEAEMLPSLNVPTPPSSASVETSDPHVLGASISHSPDHYPCASNLFADTNLLSEEEALSGPASHSASEAERVKIAPVNADWYDAITASHKTISHASAHAEPLSAGNAKRFSKRRRVGVLIACWVVVCIVATFFLALSISRSTQGHQAIPAIETTVPLPSPTPGGVLEHPTTPALATPTPEHPTTPALATPIPEATTTPEEDPVIVPSPTSEPTPTFEPTPTPKPHGRGH